MTYHSLWIIILKIFGIYLAQQLLYPLGQSYSLLVMAARGERGEAIEQFGYLIFSLGIYLFMIAGLLFKTAWLINKFKPDINVKEEKLELNIHRSTVLTIAIIFTGITLLIESLPNLLKELYTYYQVINSFRGFKDYNRASWIIIDSAKVFIGFFLLTSSRLIVNFIEKRRKGDLSSAKTNNR